MRECKARRRLVMAVLESSKFSAEAANLMYFCALEMDSMLVSAVAPPPVDGGGATGCDCGCGLGC